MPSILIESAKIVVHNELTTADLLLDDGVIKKITKLKLSARSDETIPADPLIAPRGLIFRLRGKVAAPVGRTLRSDN